MLSIPAPTLAAEAMGRFKVWVLEFDDHEGTVPAEDTVNDWLGAVSPLMLEILAPPAFVQERMPNPFVDKTCPELPSAGGRVQVTEAPIEDGALRATKEVLDEFHSLNGRDDLMPMAPVTSPPAVDERASVIP